VTPFWYLSFLPSLHALFASFVYLHTIFIKCLISEPSVVSIQMVSPAGWCTIARCEQQDKLPQKGECFIHRASDVASKQPWFKPHWLCCLGCSSAASLAQPKIYYCRSAETGHCRRMEQVITALHWPQHWRMASSSYTRVVQQQGGHIEQITLWISSSECWNCSNGVNIWCFFSLYDIILTLLTGVSLFLAHPVGH